MKVKLTGEELLLCQQHLRELTALRPPVALAYLILRNAKVIREEAQLAGQVELQILQKYGHDNGNGTWTLAVEDEGYPKGIAELRELYKNEHELELEPFALPADAVISPDALMAFDKFVSEPGA